MIFLSSFIIVKIVEIEVIRQIIERSNQNGIEVVVYNSEVIVKGISTFDVYIDYKANLLRLTSVYNVENLKIIDASRVSP